MLNNHPKESIHINGLTLWAHVGVLESERALGQEFRLDCVLWLDLTEVSKNDNINYTADYSLCIKQLQHLSTHIKCQTIEKFSEYVLNILESTYGTIPMQIYLVKVKPPIPGFNGSVGVRRTRNFN